MSIKKIRILFICLVGSFLTLPTNAIAGADSGFYLGVGAGDTKLKDSGFSESDSGTKLLGGFNIGFIPLIDLAVEASYVDFGNLATFDVAGVNAFGLAGLSFGPFGVFAKAGVMNWEAESTVFGNSSGSDSAYGLGARFSISSFTVRAEYEVFDIDGIDLEMVSISGIYTF